VLIGLPGVGKTSVGARLANRLGVSFADSDRLIEQADGRGIPQIFAADGEAAFRKLEAAVVLEALATFDGVLALGGGAVTSAEVRRGLAESQLPVVLLTASQPELVARVGRNRNRPLLADDPAARLAELAAEREEFYRDLCTLTIDTGGRSIGAVAELILRQLLR
jgi:shikimate kinase